MLHGPDPPDWVTAFPILALEDVKDVLNWYIATKYVPAPAQAAFAFASASPGSWSGYLAKIHTFFWMTRQSALVCIASHSPAAAAWHGKSPLVVVYSEVLTCTVRPDRLNL